MFTIQNPDPLIYIEEAEVKLDRRSKGKSLSLQRNFNSEPSPNGFRRQIKLKDSFQNIESAPHPNIYSHEETSRRSKSIVKKPFLNQRNIPQIMTSRHKNIYSANAYILSSNLQLQNQSLESSRRPEERFSDSKLLAFKNKAIILERRNKQFIRPFCLGPQNNLTIKTKLNNTMKKSKLEDFTLPDIFKDSIQPSTDGTENSFIEWQHLSFDSDEECEPVQSAFLTKLEKTINKQPAGSNQGKELVSHSFGLDKI